MTRRHCLIILLVMVFMVFLPMGCAKTADSSPGKLTVAVTIVPQEAFVKAVAGDLVDVVTMVPPGRSPENYAPTPQQLESFSKAALYFSIGVPVEDAYILKRMDSLNHEMKIVPLADRVGEVYPHRYFDKTHETGYGEESINDTGNGHNAAGGHSHTGRDPHIWLSPKRVEVMIDVIAEELSQIDIANKAVYEKNASEFKARLNEVDDEIEKALTKLKNKTFIVFHPAFGYFADDYGLKMVALEEEGKEATPKSLQEKIDMAKEEGIKVIFYQAEIDSRQSRVFAQELGGRAEMLEPLSYDYLNNLKKIAKTFSEVME
jgi:zinc transport system substrate-binding protein